MTDSMLETVFSATGLLAMLGWLGLILLPRFPLVVQTIARLVIPALIAVVYLWLMISQNGQTPEDGGFGSLAEVGNLFSVPGLLLAGWVHYLAFDLFVGSWEVEDAQRHGVPHWLVIPCLIATFLAGPAGLALYLLVRFGTGVVRGRAPAVS